MAGAISPLCSASRGRQETDRQVIERFVKGEPEENRLRKLNRLVNAIQPLSTIVGGPGVNVSRIAGRTAVSVAGTKVLARKTVSTSEDCAGGTEDVLGSAQGTQDTDAWDRDTDGTPVSVTVITDIQYDDTTHQLTYRARELHFDKCGNLKAVDAEGDLVVITTAEVCA